MLCQLCNSVMQLRLVSMRAIGINESMNDLIKVAVADPWGMILRGIGILGIGLGGWALTVLIGVQTDVRILQANFAYFSQDRYRADEARRDFALRDLELNTLKERVATLERELHSTKTQVEEISPPVRRQPR